MLPLPMNSTLVPINRLVEEPYSLILGYPRATKSELTRRLSELKKHGISSVTFEGQTILNNIRVLGKGYVGVVVFSKKGKQNVAIKIRRTDSTRDELKTESKLLKLANHVHVGPNLISGSKNFLVMEYLEGKNIIDWVRELKGKGSAEKLRIVVRKVLEDCYRLDNIHLDHGELSYIHKHVIVGKVPCVIDFESASTQRRVSNVTSATQSIFIGSALSVIVKKIIKIPDKKKLILILKKYKSESTRENFDELLKILGVDKI